MSFVFHDRDTFEWPVKLCVPNGGSHDEIEITGIFEMGSESEWMASDPDVSTASEAIDFEVGKLKAVFKGWKDGDIMDAQGNPFAATDKNIAAFLAKRPNRLAVSEAYIAALTPTKGTGQKLRAAAQIIWGKAALSDQLISDYAGLNGVTKDEAKEVLSAQLDQGDREMVLPLDMRPAIELAIHSYDQVRIVAGMSGVFFHSFDQTAVEAVQRRHGIEMNQDQALDLTILQAEGLKLMNAAL